MTDQPTPDPTDLYRIAPPLLEEAADLLTVSSRILTETLAGEPVDEAYERDYYLRRAVQADRVALTLPGGRRNRDHAAQSARLLAHFDREHAHLAPADVPVPDPDTAPDETLRAYTRACYTAAPWT
ncbi:hypothetical protein [Streptomyces sp. NPDC059708]|uniref:hypothetical protein n=1 Tax=Streptomyces sp. NPDC059708 TaxID=3346916 RepID=UPI0036C34207